MKKPILIAGVFIALIFSACKRETEDFQPLTINDYAPLEVGKYITYNLDSLVFYKNFGRTDTTISYQVKYEVDAAITDNLGRPAYRIFRYIRKTSSDSWLPDNSFPVINTGSNFEFIENNMRFIKLSMPIQDNFEWRGNTYLGDKPFADLYSFSNDNQMNDWHYGYSNVNQPAQIGDFDFDSTLTVDYIEQDTSEVFNPDLAIFNRTFYEEKYAKGIGLVSREFIMWEYQNIEGTDNKYKNGFGVKLTIIDHN